MLDQRDSLINHRKATGVADLLGIGSRVTDADEDACEAQSSDDGLVHLCHGHVYPKSPAA